MFVVTSIKASFWTECRWNMEHQHTRVGDPLPGSETRSQARASCPDFFVWCSIPNPNPNPNP